MTKRSWKKIVQYSYIFHQMGILNQDELEKIKNHYKVRM
ncbi:hypothetical protein JOC86_000670 [Bacillus pakistanensis]|uniref:Uncharacterized protein n=1 Tax=Rossellomorea pakistanensis TaxID=992288 RepID=A0ABS2N8E6_9BACI|nr:hypothetical protein [Bacillus pakistanensis]